MSQLARACALFRADRAAGVFYLPARRRREALLAISPEPLLAAVMHAQELPRTAARPATGALCSDIPSANVTAKATLVLAAIVTAALASGLVYLIFLRGQSGLERMDLTTEAQVLRAYERMVPAAEALDADELFRFTTENDRGALVSGGRILRTQADARDRTRESFAGLASLKYTFTERHVTVLSSNAALLIVAGTSHAKTTDGRELSLPFVQSVVFTREKGEWRVLHTHQSSPPR